MFQLHLRALNAGYSLETGRFVFSLLIDSTTVHSNCPALMRSLYYCLQRNNLLSEIPIVMVYVVVVIVRNIFGPCIVTSSENVKTLLTGSCPWEGEGEAECGAMAFLCG